MSPTKPVGARIRGPRAKDETRKLANLTVAARGAASRELGRPGLRFEEAAFAYSVHDPGAFPPPGAPEIAFAGRSNAGKSSAFNALTRRRRLAFVSRTPGRTQLVNFFALGKNAFLVDLPGYGYAGVPMDVRMHWKQLVGTYIRTRSSLASVVVVMDARHPLTALDCDLLAFLAPARLAVHVLLTKSDKLSRALARSTLQRVQARLEALSPGATVQLFSGTSREGVAEAARTISRMVEVRERSENKSPG